MGKDWLFWGRSAAKREKMKRVERERVPLTGCMGSMLQLLNFSNAKVDYFIQDEQTTIQGMIGVEAPRNSLEEEEVLESKENLLMPIGIRIKTYGGSDISKLRDDKKSNDLSLDLCAASPSANTPNLVARLMGLNHLPENFSPSLSSKNLSNFSNDHQKEYRRSQSINGRYLLDIDITGCRSLPESPRVSASRRSDVDYPRLSLQSCKENVNVFDDFKSFGKNRKVKQENEREGLGRNFGTDISNNSTMINKEQRRDYVLLAKPKKPLEKRNKQNQESNSSLQGVKINKEKASKKIKRSESQRFSQISKKMQKPDYDTLRNKKEETFVRKSKESRAKKSKKTPMLGDILNLSVTPIFPVKKEPLSPTKPPSKQESDICSSKRRIQLSSSLVQPYNKPMTCQLSSNGVTQAQFQYITEVLKFLGIDKNTPILFAKLHSPSHPLHPSVFNCLELTFSGSKDTQLRHRSNRKLVFELVDEILVDILKPCLFSKPRVFSNTIPYDYRRDGSLLIDQLFVKIRSFKAIDCNVLEDIDQLIDNDFRRSELLLSVAFEEESETIVAQLESDIFNSLVHEIVADVLYNWGTV